jgi:Cu-processing system ATP-binding protein
MISIQHLEKHFGALHVLNDFSAECTTGETTAILGPNASGKSTLIKSLLGLVKPDSGSILVNGMRINGDCNYRRDLGYMAQIAHFPENLTGNDVLSMIKDLRNDTAVDTSLIEDFKLQSELKKPFRTLSGGTRQKVSAVIAFLFNPKIIILDEPTAGLDPISCAILKEKILDEKRRGKTILITSHILADIEQLCDRMIFMVEGTKQFEGPISELLDRHVQRDLENAIIHLMRGVAV